MMPIKALKAAIERIEGGLEALTLDQLREVGDAKLRFALQRKPARSIPTWMGLFHYVPVPDPTAKHGDSRWSVPYGGANKTRVIWALEDLSPVDRVVAADDLIYRLRTGTRRYASRVEKVPGWGTELGRNLNVWGVPQPGGMGQPMNRPGETDVVWLEDVAGYWYVREAMTSDQSNPPRRHRRDRVVGYTEADGVRRVFYLAPEDLERTRTPTLRWPSGAVDPRGVTVARRGVLWGPGRVGVGA